VKGLELEGFISSNTFNTNSKVFLKNYAVYRPDLVNNSLLFVSNYPGINSISESYSNGSRTNYLAQATYNKALQNHKFKLLGGFQSEEYRVTSLSASRDSLINDQPYINNAISTSRRNAGGASEFALAGFYGRFNYNFNDKYLLEINGRYDGSSRFSQQRDRQWGFFPSFSAGWVISQEGFFSGFKNVVNYMKIRGSYGELGNQNVPGFIPSQRCSTAGKTIISTGPPLMVMPS
jgi:hypothetical protein